MMRTVKLSENIDVKECESIFHIGHYLHPNGLKSADSIFEIGHILGRNRVR